jgi:gliding motility-associated-like protein
MKKIVSCIFIFSFAMTANCQQADFTYTSSSGSFCSPAMIYFTEAATGSPTGFVWNFGNGTGSNAANPIVTYNNAGSFTVQLIVIYPQTSLSVTKTIVVNPALTISIGYDRNYICNPGIIHFTGTGNGNITSYQWDFGDGSGTVTTASDTISHIFANLGSYTVQLKATNSSACSASAEAVIIYAKLPPMTGTISPASGCIPETVSMTANVTIPPNSTVSNYLWDFGDGSPPASTANNTANHVYLTAGSYAPSVIATSSEGCTGTYNFNAVAFGTPPFNENAYPVHSIICGSDSAVFVSTAANANIYYWDFGDGIQAFVADTIVHHKYNSLGTKNVTVTPYYNGCAGNPINFQITVQGVIAGFTYANTCTDKKTFFFTNTSQGNLSAISWDFGDGSPSENTVNPTHTFPVSGSFVTKLTVTDSLTGCSDSSYQTIYTSSPILINPDTFLCKNSTTTFTVLHGSLNPADTYTWHVAGLVAGPFNDSAYTAKATITGNFNNYVIINHGPQSCPDTISLGNTLVVKGPGLSFTGPAALCQAGSYTVSNTSPANPADSVVTWYWNFGENSVNDTTFQPQPYVYKNAGLYNVTLAGIDINGCKDSLVETVTVHPLPYLYVVPAIDTLCAGSADTLLAYHSDSLQWSPSGFLSCTICDTTLTNTNADTKYYATATSVFGCRVTDTVALTVFNPFTTVASLIDPSICLGDTVQFHVDPPGKRILWSPATGLSKPNIYDPIATPLQSTNYIANLTDSAGCFTSSAGINVTVKSLPQVNAGPDQTLPYNSLFSINPTYSNKISSYSWTPGSLLNCTTCPDPTGLATSSNTFFITVTSDSGCIAEDSIKIFIECSDANLLMPNAFTPNNDGHNDFFYPLTRGVQSITRFSIYDRFGKLVYEARNFPPNEMQFGWDGKFNGSDQSTAVFVYYVEAICDLGEKLYKKGSVVLIR